MLDVPRILPPRDRQPGDILIRRLNDLSWLLLTQRSSYVWAPHLISTGEPRYHEKESTEISYWTSTAVIDIGEGFNVDRILPSRSGIPSPQESSITPSSLLTAHQSTCWYHPPSWTQKILKYFACYLLYFTQGSNLDPNKSKQSSVFQQRNIPCPWSCSPSSRKHYTLLWLLTEFPDGQ